MPAPRGEIESEGPVAASQPEPRGQGLELQYADIAIAALGVLALAWIADQLGGRRGLFGAALVAGIGAGCGWFLAVRVFGAATMNGWLWLVWALSGTALCLAAYYLFRSKR